LQALISKQAELLRQEAEELMEHGLDEQKNR